MQLSHTTAPRGARAVQTRACRPAPARAAPASPSASTSAVAAAIPSPRLPPRRRRFVVPARAASSSPSTTTAADAEQQQKRRREALLRVVRDLYSTLYDFDDLSITALVSPEVILEDDALQVSLSGPQQVGDYLRWLHAGVDAGEPATATIDAAPLEKAILAGAEAVLADEVAAAAKKAGFTIHTHDGEREDCVIATWVAGEDGEVRGRDEFFFEASGASDPPIVRIHTSRATAGAA
jgi:hypothetical protein